MAGAKIIDGVELGLREVVEELAAHGWAAELADDRWRLVWVSDELETVYGQEHIRLGEHILRTRMAAYDAGVVTRENAGLWLGKECALHARGQ